MSQIKSAGPTFDNLFQKWGSANRMRIWFSEQKIEISEKVKKENREDEETKEYDELVKEVKEKALFLVKLKEPEIWDTIEKKKKTVILRVESILTRDESTMAENIKKRFSRWHSVQRSKGVQEVQARDTTAQRRCRSCATMVPFAN